MVDSFSTGLSGREENRGHHDIQYNDTQHNDNQINDIQQNDSQQNDSQQKGLIRDTQHYDIQNT
jgi:hypothetical protein